MQYFFSPKSDPVKNVILYDFMEIKITTKYQLFQWLNFTIFFPLVIVFFQFKSKELICWNWTKIVEIAHKDYVRFF